MKPKSSLFLIATIYFLFFALTCLKVNAQQTIWLLDGKKISTHKLIINYKDSTLAYKKQNGHESTYPLDQVFSAIDSSGKEQIFYFSNGADRQFTIEQMRAFLQGEQNSTANYSANKAGWIGFGIGLVAPISLPYLNVHYILSPLISAAYCGYNGMNVLDKNKLTIPSEFQNNQYYIQGYQEAANKKRMRKSLKGSGIGLITGFAALFLFYR